MVYSSINGEADHIELKKKSFSGAASQEKLYNMLSKTSNTKRALV